MATRPAKRQRRSNVASSNDDDAPTKSTGLPLRTPRSTHDGLSDRRHAVNTPARSSQNGQGRPSSLGAASSLIRSPSSSPRKTRKTSDQAFDTKNNKSLYSFFNKATEEQRWQRKVESVKEIALDDDITDDIVDDDSFDDNISRSSDGKAVRPTSVPTSKLITASRSRTSRSSTPSLSQKFAKAPSVSDPPLHNATGTASGLDEVSGHRPWAERYGPSSVEELAIHKKKIADVQRWLEDAMAARSAQKILVLKGPAGSGKSTTLSLVARALNIRITTWQNPSVSDAVSISSIQQFAEFLDTGGKYESLAFGINGEVQGPSSALDRQLLSIEEFPALVTRSIGGAERFRSLLLQYLLRNRTAAQSSNRAAGFDDIQPLVLILSETLLSSSTTFSDSFTAHRLLGVELLNHPLISVIEFNPVAPTFISKALDLVIKKEARDSRRKRIPGPAVLQKLSDIGDIRSATNSLEFLCARGDDDAIWSGTVAARSKKAIKDGVRLTDAEQNTLKLIGQRESTLDMFHAAGKVVYNKREDPRTLDSRAEPPSKPPDHLMHLYTPKATQVDVEALLNEVGTDIQTFISTLHENYVLSCNCDDFVDVLDGCAHTLSDADILNPESRSVIRSKTSSRLQSHDLQSGNFDMLRQDEISFHVASSGLVFRLPFPVNRAVPYGSKRQDAFKMFYPASLRLWKPTEEINGLISLFGSGDINTDSASPMLSGAANGVASWKSRSLEFGTTVPLAKIGGEEPPPPRPCTSRDSLVTEVLPYLTLRQIRQKRECGYLKKITQFYGVDVFGGTTADDEYELATVSLPPVTSRLSQRVEQAHRMLNEPKLPQAHSKLDRKGSDDGFFDPKERLYISDDDIQDD